MVLSTMPSGTREKSKDERELYITISRNKCGYSLTSKKMGVIKGAECK